MKSVGGLPLKKSQIDCQGTSVIKAPNSYGSDAPVLPQVAGDDDRLIAALMVGDARASYAAATLYDRYEIQMLRFFRAHALSVEDAEDVLQVTFVKIIEKAHALKEVSNGRAWIWQIARNTLLDFLRQRKFLSHRQELFDEEEIDDHSEPPVQYVTDTSRHAEDCVTAGLIAFKGDFPDRWYVVSEQLEGKDIAAIATVIGRTTAATTVFISQSKKKLAPYIERCRSLLAQ